MRAALLVLILTAAAALLWWQRTPAPAPAAEAPRFTYVLTARQRGVVGYRDPAGALSPDGTRVAYSEGRDVRVVPIGGGAPRVLPRGIDQIRSLAWAGPDRVVGEDPAAPIRWWVYDLADGHEPRAPLWGDRPGITATASGAAPVTVPANDVRQLAWSADGARGAGLVNTKEGPELWTVSADGATAERRRLEGRPSAPAFTPRGDVACIASDGGHPRLALTCDGPVTHSTPDVDVVGPLAFSPDSGRVYFASPDGTGMVDLWSMDLATRHAQRLSSFGRDTYAPSVASDGRVLFKQQIYRVFVADAPAEGGATRQLATFQSETPSWHPTDPRLAFTYGTWRRVLDDAAYPDIAQEIGVIRLDRALPAAAPAEIVAQSNSEDQAMAWSPNGRWVALHSHREMSDDVWLRPADGSTPDRRITFLGRGAEVGWPRWSPDGKSVLLDGARKSDGRSVLYVIGVDQASGAVTSDLREVPVEGFGGDLTHAEWMPDGTAIVALGTDAPGQQAIVKVPVAGGRATLVHRFASEHNFSGLGVSPDGRSVAFSAPAPDGRWQIFRMPVSGGPTTQVTSDPSDKSQPSWSPDGARIAFTIWSYDAVLWSMK